MKNTPEHYRNLRLKLPMECQEADKYRGKLYPEIGADILQAVGHEGGLIYGGTGSRTRGDGIDVELTIDLWYKELADAVRVFERCSSDLAFPDGTRLTHVERFPDLRFVFHTMITWRNQAPMDVEVSLEERNRMKGRDGNVTKAEQGAGHQDLTRRETKAP